MCALLVFASCKKNEPIDEAKAAGKSTADFPQITADIFKPMDGGINLSPNEIMGSVLPLEAPAVVGAIVTQSCLPRAAEQHSTLTVEARRAPAAIAGEFLPSPPAEGALVANAVPPC